MGVSRRIVVLVLGLLARGAHTQTMQHPGVLVSGAQLEFVKAQVKAKGEPFYSEYKKATDSTFGSLNYQVKGPPKTGIIECGSHSNPDNGCHAEDSDASAAYLQAVLWIISGNKRYAENAIKILNAYANLKAYTNSNAPLQAAWSGQTFPRAAEILRYTNSGWKQEDQVAFAKMLRGVILPQIYKGSGSNGNWELSMVDAMMGIAVFTDDRALLDHAEAMWKARVEAYFYNFELDGPHPKSPPKGQPNWYGTTDLDASVDGMAQETCRDLGHTGYGIAATMNAAETAHIQGDKLFEEEEKRLVPALEFDTRLLLKKEPVPRLVCGGKVEYSEGYTFVIGYNEYHNRLGLALPNTKEWVEQHVETAKEPVEDHMMVFEGLTHGADAASASH